MAFPATRGRILWSASLVANSKDGEMKITLHGAAGGEVTGSCYQLQTRDSNVLIDCGLFQAPFRCANAARRWRSDESQCHLMGNDSLFSRLIQSERTGECLFAQLALR